MTDLTEQWKKGELKKNKYWVKYKNGKIDTWELSEGITIESKPEIIEVLAPVPSFQEWQAKDSQIDYLQQKVSVLESKNQQLKELLEECRLAIFDYPPYNLASDKIRLKNKIDEVLK